MTNQWAQGKRAFGFCDICGFRYPLHTLRKQIIDQKPVDILTCAQCNDVDNPQLQLGKFPVIDPIALRNPRPDLTLAQSRALWGWAPVFNPAIEAQTYVGVVTVLTVNN